MMVTSRSWLSHNVNVSGLDLGESVGESIV
jgi:hypothetical protein